MSKLKSVFEKVLGLDKIKTDLLNELHSYQEEIAIAKHETELLKQNLEITKQEMEHAVESKEDALKSKKELATKHGEPWVGVVDTNIDHENPHNGFFELDWNKPFIDMLISHGYGYESDPEEEIVDRWYRALATSILQEHDMPTNVMGGYINVRSITNDHSEVM